jgi:hypothetical protein
LIPIRSTPPVERNFFKQHLPNFFTIEDGDLFETEFDTLEELLQHDYFKWWVFNTFDCWSLCGDKLMYERKKGIDYYVVGYIRYPERLNLPKWKPLSESQKKI